MSLRESVTAEVLTWPGVSAHSHRFGGTEYRLGTRETLHLHGDHLLDVPFPRRVRDELISAGLASAHHILQGSGWVSFRPRGDGDRAAVLALLRRSYDLALKQRSRRAADGEETQEQEDGLREPREVVQVLDHPLQEPPCLPST